MGMNASGCAEIRTDQNADSTAVKKLSRYAELLLDTGKRNNLVNFKNTKLSTVEVVAPDIVSLFKKADSSAVFEVYNPPILEVETDVEENVKDEELDDIQAAPPQEFVEALTNTPPSRADDETFIEAAPPKQNGEPLISVASNSKPQKNIVPRKVKSAAAVSTQTAPAQAAAVIDPFRMSRDAYIAAYAPKLKKNRQILLYNPVSNPLVVIKNIHKKAQTAIEETGVNVAYMAFGFIHWKESENANTAYHAPVLLVPVLFQNESPIDPYYVKMTEDDIVVNPTFNYKLQSEYGLRLPDYNDESLDEYMGKVTELVSKLGFTTSIECKIAIFSFLKINMYRDIIDHTDEILGNDKVKALLGETCAEGTAGNTPSPVVHNDLVDLHNVVDADSSQLEAIKMAKSGIDFVLQGPPGTGKSQTITNIIAEALSDGKTVLFVSEKLAALNVVYEKLKNAGMEEFCLELHSHKANKKDVIRELCRTLQAKKSSVSNAADTEIAAKIKYQHQLDAYVEALHKPLPTIHKSLYQLYCAHAAFRAAPDIDYAIPDVLKLDEIRMNAVTALLEQYVTYIPDIGSDYRSNRWYGCRVQNSSPHSKATLQKHLEILLKTADTLHAVSDTLSERYGISVDNIEDFRLYHKFLRFAAESEFLTPKLLTSTSNSTVGKKVKILRPLANRIREIRTKLSEEYTADLLKINGKDFHDRLTTCFSGAFSRLFSKEYKQLISDLHLCKKNGKSPKYEEAVQVTATLERYQQLVSDYTADELLLKCNFGRGYLGVDTDWDALEADLKQIGALLRQAIHYGTLSSLPYADFETAQTDFLQIADELDRVFALGNTALVEVQNAFDPSLFDVSALPLSSISEKASACLGDMDHLDAWCRFHTLLTQLVSSDVTPFLEYTIDRGLDPSDIVSAYKKAFYRQQIDSIIYATPVFSEFARISQDQATELFSQKDELQFEINKARIKAELSEKRPSHDMLTSGSAVSLLLREGEKKRKQKGIRTLLSEMGELIQLLKPCFLMSPLSVSTFLSGSDMQFDLVVFDEASQIFPQDAIGAIYRSKQLIVVGDSNQMPPSNFFNTNTDMDDDEDVGDVADFESILDVCSAAFSQLRLKWHYRSRYEQLISFSNKNFYDSDLITFPSSKTDKPEIGVDYHYVDGIFDHKTKSNRKEADCIVDLIYQHIDKYPERSLGVVAFSISQQELIDKLLAKRRLQNPSKEFFFRSDRKEPFFVKNLETVQGDERDTVIFSIGYGKDAQGHLKHNFGPLNRLGGERRLNVAVTRAKINVCVVSSMHSTDIDLSRTKSDGVRLLKDYLHYAEHGESVRIADNSADPLDKFEFEFETEVCEFLRGNGFTVDTQVGDSAFRIDLAVKQKNSPDYALAIECDGASYHSAKNARDRDRLRREVLERMGWKFYRIWSTDWLKNNRVEKEKLLEAVTEAVEHSNAAPPPDSAQATVKEGDLTFEEAVTEETFAFPVYREMNLLKVSKKHSGDFLKMLKEVLTVEAPLSEEWLLKRSVALYGREKVTSVVQRMHEKNMNKCLKNGIIRRDGFLWLENQPEVAFRVYSAAKAKIPRELRYVSEEELAAGMYELIRQNVSVDKNGLFRSISNLLGFARAGNTAIERFERALASLSDRVEINGSTVSIL